MNHHPCYRLGSLLLVLLFAAPEMLAAERYGADTIYLNARVYTVNERLPWAEAFAIKDGRFVAVGRRTTIERLQDHETNVIDLEGKLVLPGLIDDHMHPDMAAENFFNVNVDAEKTTWAEFKQLVQRYLEEHPDEPWVFGGNLDYLWDDGSDILMFGQPSHKSILDELIPDRPAYFWEVSGHAALVNSKALEVVGISRDTPDPPGGHYVRDENGELTGVLRELAAHVVWEEYLKARPPVEVIAHEQMKPILRYLSSLGLTSISDVWAREWFLKAYGVLDDAGELPVRVSVYLTDPVDWVLKDTKETAIRAINDPGAYETDKVQVLGVKFVLDGGAAGRTAAMIDPYEGSDYTGPWRTEPERFTQKLLDYDSRGLTVRAHAAGDSAIRTVLDAVEETRRRGSVLRHGVAHTAILNPSDLRRFAELGVIAEVSPVFWYQMPAVDVIDQDIGAERVGWLYPLRGLWLSGARMSVGSDWTVTPANPWAALETMVTRRMPGAVDGPALHSRHALTLEEAIEIYTLGGAYAQYQEAEIGSIEPGKQADFIVVDQNIFEVPINQVHATEVLSTVVAGKVVYSVEDKAEIIDFYGTN